EAGVLSVTEDAATAECSYRGFRHIRTMAFDRRNLRVTIEDRIEGPPGEHTLEQFWHFGGEARQLSPTCVRIGERASIHFDDPASMTTGWISPVFAARMAAPVACVKKTGALPSRFHTVLDLQSNAILST